MNKVKKERILKELGDGIYKLELLKKDLNGKRNEFYKDKLVWNSLTTAYYVIEAQIEISARSRRELMDGTIGTDSFEGGEE